MVIAVEDTACQIPRCRGLEWREFGEMGFYHIFDRDGRDLTGQARFRDLRKAAEWLVSPAKWNAE